MGCSGGKLDVEASMEIARANPLQGLRPLKDALKQHANPGQDESAKKNIPQVFELLPEAIDSLRVKEDWRAVVAAGAVIERCVKLVNDPGLGLDSPAIDPENLTQCTRKLCSLLNGVCIQAFTEYGQDMAFPFDTSAIYTRDAVAIAGALNALFKLERYAAVCRQEFRIHGLGDAVDCLLSNSGLAYNGRQALLTMLVGFLEEPESAQDFIDNDGVYVLLPYCANPMRYGISIEFQSLCGGLLESCIKNGQWATPLRGFSMAEVEATCKDMLMWRETLERAMKACPRRIWINFDA